MKKVTTLLSILCALALVVIASGCASTKKNTENLLSAAGFKMVPANTPQRQAHLNTLPPNKVSMTQRDGKQYFIYPDPAHNVLYVGQQDQYNQYQKLREQNQMAQEQVEAAQLNADWGPWGVW